jgi:hypothetical protein
MRGILIILALTCSLVLCQDCTGPMLSFGGAHQTVFLPYIETAEVPSNVIQDEQFTITLKLSASLNPDLLRGVSVDLSVSSSGWVGYGLAPELETSNYDMWPLLGDPTYEGTTAPEYIFPCSIPRPGNFKLRIRSADLPENGGLQFERQLTPSVFYPDNPHCKWLEYEITVLPKTP